MITKKFSIFFPYFESKVCSQDYSTNELKVDFLSDLVIFNNFFVDPEPCRPGVNSIRFRAGIGTGPGRPARRFCRPGFCSPARARQFAARFIENSKFFQG